MDVPGPHHGTVLVVEDEELRGYMAGADEPEWSVPLSEFGWQGENLEATSGKNAGEVTAMLIGSSAEDRALIDLASGEVITDGLSQAARAATSGTWVTLGEQLQGFDEVGNELFSLADASELTIETVGGVLAYLQQGEQLVTYNAVTGDPAQPYDLDSSGPLAVPVHITGTGIGVVQVEGELLLAVTD